MRISDWSSDVCSADLFAPPGAVDLGIADRPDPFFADSNFGPPIIGADGATRETARSKRSDQGEFDRRYHVVAPGRLDRRDAVVFARNILNARSEEHTHELQSIMHHTYAVFSLKK